MDDDDRPIGRLLTRREAVALLGGGAGALIVAACAPGVLSTLAPSSPASTATQTALATATPTAAAVSSLPACVVKPALTEGPFFVDEKIERTDIRSDTSSGAVEAGVPLFVTFAVSKVSGNTCTLFEGAVVDVWHCNVAGTYSDVQQNSTVGQNFLRGYQVTDGNGIASFATVYPGWYRGRTDPAASTGLEFTSQLFFDEAVTAEVFAQQPYAARGTQDTTNAKDSIYRDGGSQLLLTPGRSGAGYSATFEIGVVV